MHNDQWDLDWAFEQQVIDLPVAGATRHLVVTSGKMGIIEAMDAATGQYLFSKDQGIQNVISAIDPQTGEKTINPAVVVGDGMPHTIWPASGRRARNWNATSYNPDTKILYTPMVESCMDLIPAAPGERGNLSSGYNWTIRPRPDTDGKYGRFEALNLETREVLWTDRQRAPGTTCMLATAGGVVFAGSLDRYLRAYDDTTGKELWTVRMSDVPSSCPISYSVQGPAVHRGRCRQWRDRIPDLPDPRAGDPKSPGACLIGLGVRAAAAHPTLRRRSSRPAGWIPDTHARRRSDPGRTFSQ
ncbi:MAG: PQQ-binding-like beta-propeller repeat protein [Steroidobacteraceae bacterium]